jgi:hypothetical protein
MAVEGFTMSPPYGGLDLVSPIDNMDSAFALELVNVFPGAGAPTVRLGYEQVTTSGASISGAIRSMYPLYLKDGTSKLIIATATKLYSMTSAGVVSDITKTVAHTNGDFQAVTYANNIYLCNGVDNAQAWTGTSVAADLTFTGVALNKLVGVTAYKERLYFIESGTSKVWYGGLQVTGTAATPALTSFDFQYVFTRGGYLVGIGSFSNTTSTTSQDYFWACSSEGEIVFYNGTYAGDATTWALVARYVIGAPLGHRAFIRVNNDIWILTQQGIVPVSALFQADPEQALNVISTRVNPLISEYSSVIGFSHQWTGFFWPAGRRVYINIPIANTASFFLVYSIDTKGWTEFRLFDNTHCLSSCDFNNLPYYGSNSGVVWKGETGQVDARTSTDGQSISFSGRTAFSFYGSRGNYKAFKDIRPILKAKRGVSLNLGLDTDFKRGAITSTTASGASTSYTPWGSPWGSPWSADVEYIFDRYAVKGQGHCAAVRFSGALKNSTCQILGFEIRFDVGGQV